MIAVEVNLSDWLYNAVAVRELLTLNRDYSDLGSCWNVVSMSWRANTASNQVRWAVGMELLL
jgi:hypothetical protein